MSEEIPNSGSTGIPQELEQTGASGKQEETGIPTDLIPAVPKEPQPGLRGALEDVVGALFLRSPQLRSIIKIVAKDYVRRLASAEAIVDKLRSDLQAEKIAHARTEERLKNAQQQTGAHVLLQLLGAISLTYGLTELETGSLAWVFIAIGLGMILYGCWPFVSARWWRRD